MRISWLLFSLRGRIRRRDWWLGTLGLSLLLLVGQSVIYARSGPGGAPGALHEPPALTALSLLMLWPGVALAVKREHDRDGSGWRSLILTLTAALIGYAPDLAPGWPGWLHKTLFGLALLMLLYLLVTLGILDGTRGDNRFGPSPKRFDPPEL